MEKRAFTIFDSQSGFSYEDYKEFCEINEIEPEPEDSNGYWDWVYDERRWSFDGMMCGIKNSKIDYPLMITGKLGLWNCSPDIVPVPMVSGYKNPSLEKAILKCIGGDVEDFEIKFESGEIVVYGHHHDGTNVLHIRKLSKKGIKGMEAAKNRYEDCNPKEWWFAKIKESEIDF